MKTTIKQQLLLTFCIAVFTIHEMVGQAPPMCGHCGQVAGDVNEACKALGQTGGVIIFRDNNGTLCYCNCSCLAFFTPIAIGDNTYKKIGEVQVGENILTLSKEKKWVKTPVTFSGGTDDATYTNPYMIYVKTEDNATLIATADHLFYMPDGTLKRADRLNANDRLVNDLQKPVKIIELTSGEYVGKIHNVATGTWSKDDVQIDGHLINTFGVISGDYFLQLNYKNENTENQPQLGASTNLPKINNLESMAYSISSDGKIVDMKKNGKSDEYLNVTTKQIKNTTSESFGESTYSFTPSSTKKAPADAVFFIPPGQDVASVPLAPLDNTIPYEMAVYLQNHFKTYYPSIEFRINWTDDTVNAFASREGNRQVVTLYGGLIRHPYMQLEGVGLVLAHEIGHHLGGAPRYPGIPWASCEGQADYWGSKIAMRKVWWGAYAVEQLEKGSQQVYNLFAYGLQAGNLMTIDNHKPKAAGLCTHPPAQCRLDTYRSAIFLGPKPPCAGDTE
jgi:hypothetical protein